MEIEIDSFALYSLDRLFRLGASGDPILRKKPRHQGSNLCLIVRVGVLKTRMNKGIPHAHLLRLKAAGLMTEYAPDLIPKGWAYRVTALGKAVHSQAFGSDDA